MVDNSESTHRGPSITLWIVLATAGVYFLQMSSPQVTENLAMTSLLVREGQLWRLLSYMLVHGEGIFHILFNMYVLFLFGSMVEAEIGRRHYLPLYLCAGLFGSLAWLILNWNSPGGMIGASGGVMGVLTVAAILFPNERIMLLIPPIPMKLRTLVICIIILETMLEMSRHETGVAHLGHLGGIAGGALFYVIFLRRRTAKQSTRAKTFARQVHASRVVHRCESCGATEASHPQTSFRVCSTCTGAKEYCEEHLPTHEHS